jgi:hypothetical protein
MALIAGLRILADVVSRSMGPVSLAGAAQNDDSHEQGLSCISAAGRGGCG